MEKRLVGDIFAQVQGLVKNRALQKNLSVVQAFVRQIADWLAPSRRCLGPGPGSCGSLVTRSVLGTGSAFLHPDSRPGRHGEWRHRSSRINDPALHPPGRQWRLRERLYLCWLDAFFRARRRLLHLAS